MSSSSLFALPLELLQAQMSTISLIEAMFPSAAELSMPSSTSETILILQSHLEADQLPPQEAIPQSLSFAVNLSVDDSGSLTIQLHINVPLQSLEPDPQEAPPLSYNLRQPSWLSKAEVANLSSAVPTDDIFEAFEYIREHAATYSSSSDSGPGAFLSSGAIEDPTVRVWFYFPSLSTRAKRNDLVNHAPSYGLTGFVLAGKPGVLCLEGTSPNVDAYMKYIKTESWGDIPSYQKKVSERLREEGEMDGVHGKGVQRVFDGMEEITDSLGERGGARGNRGDMQALENWLKVQGLGDAFEKVIFQ